MSKVFIIGAAGKVGRRLVKQLVGRGHEAIALHRNPEPLRFEKFENFTTPNFCSKSLRSLSGLLRR